MMTALGLHKAFAMSEYHEQLSGVREQNVLTALVWSPEACIEIARRIKPSVFSTRGYRVIAEVAISYVLKYKRPPGMHCRDELDAKTQGITSEAKFLVETFEAMDRIKDETNPQYILDSLDQFIEKQTMLNELAKAADAAQSNELEDARKHMDNARKPLHSAKALPDLGDLVRTEFPPLRYIVDRLIPTGLTLLAGAPKSGKSWLLLDIALAARESREVLGQEVIQTEVLYLSLEDNSRRLQQRTKLIVGDFHARGIYYGFAGDVPKLDEGLIPWLEYQLEEHANVRLIVIDPLGFIVGKTPPNCTPYQAEVNAIRELKILAESRDVSMLIATHTRKTKGDGRLDKVGGTHGLTGTFDTILMLERETGENEKHDDDGDDVELQDRRARLQIIGRDAMAETDKMVLFRADTRRWQLVGSYHRHRAAAEKNNLQDRILNFMKSGDASPRLQDIAKAVGASSETVRSRLNRMREKGLVESSQWGMWGLAKRTSQ